MAQFLHALWHWLFLKICLLCFRCQRMLLLEKSHLHATITSLTRVYVGEEKQFCDKNWHFESSSILRCTQVIRIDEFCSDFQRISLSGNVDNS